ncbi:hypothetical protein F0562_016300 [Nyssa sinensis]|uniref:TOG domain-containing protein n=1 Tax=Nyssa sinensis TaxID=561372 RepID=A0A5J4ZML1_9ASTE|nr:hypothetical protein F0562_016300 [Nyssa sinensis]
MSQWVCIAIYTVTSVCLKSLAGYAHLTDLHSIGGLDPLLGYLKDSPAKIQAKAAEVITTIVQNNPKGQQIVMQANGLEPLLSILTSDCDDVTVRTKALGAISSLIRHNEKGIEAFRLGQGYAALRDALSSGNARFQRKALNLIHYLLQENRSECNVISDLGFPRTMMHLASSEDTDVREAALRCLLELARDRTDGTSGSLGEKEKLKQILQDRIKGISLMSPEDLGAVKEERELVDSLWNAYYEGPSPLQKKGLVVLPGEDALPPDVASEHFQPPLRAWAAYRAADKNASTEKKETPLLLGPGPPAVNAAHAESSSSTGAAAGDGKSSTT